jgi:hypothetical protein
LPSFLELKDPLPQARKFLEGGGKKAVMSFQYYDANNPPPWLQPPWNAQQPGAAAPPFLRGSNVPQPSFTQGSAPMGAAPVGSVPLAYNPAALKVTPPPRW